MNIIQSKTGQSTMLKGAIIGAAIVIIVALVFFTHQQAVGKTSIAYGDTVILKTTIFFAKNKSIAIPESQIKIKIGNASISQAFDQNLVGLNAGEKKEFELPADEAFGKYNFALLQQYPRFKTVNRRVEVSYLEVRASLEKSYNLTQGAIVRLNNLAWPVLLEKVGNSNVTIYQEPVLNSLYVDPYILIWPLKVTSLTSQNFTIEFMPKIGSIVTDENYGNGKVVAIEADKITADYNQPLAGNDLIFDVTIVGVQKAA